MEMTSVSFEIAWLGRSLKANVPVPTGPTSPRIMLPVIQQLTNALVGMGESVVEEQGEKISCKAGCGACCRQLVPITETEARHIHDLVEAMPEPRRRVVLQRFADARERLEAGGLLEFLVNPADNIRNKTLGLEYFHLGIACPLLENESCSIHPDRPLVCREYLVMSPAENCQEPTAESIRRAPMPGFAMAAFATLDGLPPGPGVHWVPLVLAHGWAEAHPEPPPPDKGTDLFVRFMKTLTRLKRDLSTMDALQPEEEAAP
ncbi:MAG TPA: YkgJ family cysteine cluster protein [Urbifossiella sp.]|jgi:Fe-S-cluster containining protein